MTTKTLFRDVRGHDIIIQHSMKDPDIYLIHVPEPVILTIKDIGTFINELMGYINRGLK